MGLSKESTSCEVSARDHEMVTVDSNSDSIGKIQHDQDSQNVKCETPLSISSETLDIASTEKENDTSSTITINSSNDDNEQEESNWVELDKRNIQCSTSPDQDFEKGLQKTVIDETENKHKHNFSTKQWLTLIVFAFVNVWSASCVSIQAPFFPKQAEEKKVTNTESGFVFGCFQFTVLIMSPIFGKYMDRLGPKLVFNSGVTITGFCSLIFGLLTFVNDRTAFVVLAIVIRMIEATGYSAAITATFTLVAAGFPDSVCTVFASMETFNGVGLIVGPMFGVWLYDIGGFVTPFAVIGCLLLVGALLAYFVMPKVPKSSEKRTVEKAENKQATFFKLVLIPSVILAAASVFAAAVSIGFNFPTLEPNIRSLGLSGFMHGLIFITHGLTYALTAPIWGRLCDKYLDPKYVILIGAVLIFIGIGLIGPVYFLPFEKSVQVILIGLCIQGFGLGASLVAGFAQALRGAIAYGCPEGISTFGLVSGIWMAFFSLGNFVGSSIGGYLIDEFGGYPKASIFVLAVELLVVAIVLFQLIVKIGHKKY